MENICEVPMRVAANFRVSDPEEQPTRCVVMVGNDEDLFALTMPEGAMASLLPVGAAVVVSVAAEVA